MHRLLLDAIRHNKPEATSDFIDATHWTVWLNLTTNFSSVAMELIKVGDLQNLKYVLKIRPVMLNQANSVGETLLTLSVAYNQIPITQFLVEQGCQFASKLHEQVVLGNITLTEDQRILQSVVSDGMGQYPIDYAVAIGSEEKVKLLLADIKQHNIKINYSQILKLAIRNNHGHLFTLIYANMDRPETVRGLIEEVTDSESSLQLINKLVAAAEPTDNVFNEKLVSAFIMLKKDKLLELFLKAYDNDREALLRHIMTVLMLVVASSDSKTREVVAAIAKAYTDDFKRNPALLKHKIALFYYEGMEAIAYFFLSDLPKELVSSAINADVEADVMRSVLEHGYIDTFYRLQYLGVRIDIPNKSGRTIEQIINNNPALQNIIDWNDRKKIEAFIYNHMHLLDFLADFQKTRTYDVKQAQALVEKLNCNNIPYDWVATYGSTALSELWKVAIGQPDKMTHAFLLKVYELKQILLRLIPINKELNYIFSARLAFILGKPADALTDLEYFELVIQKVNNIKTDVLIYIQLHYSRLVLVIADAFKVKVASNVIELTKLSLANPGSSTNVGDGCFLKGVATVHHLAAIDQVVDYLSNYAIMLDPFWKINVTDFKQSECLRNMTSVFMGIDQLNAWLDSLEQKLVKELLGNQAVETVTLSKQNKIKLETLNKFYLMRIKIHEFANQLTFLYKKHIDDKDFHYVVNVFSADYAKGFKRVQKYNDHLFSVVNCLDDMPSEKPVHKNKKSKSQRKPVPKKLNKEDVSDDESIPRDDGCSLPTSHLEDNPYPAPVLPRVAIKTLSVASTPQVLFAAPKKAITLIKSTPEDEKVYRLKQLGYNKKFPESFLYFIAKFESGEIFVAGSAVTHVLDENSTTPHDWDVLLTEQGLKKLVIEKDGIIECNEKGLGQNHSYSIIYQRTPDEMPLKIDVTFLNELGATLVECLKKNCDKRHISIKAMLLDPFAAKKNQIYDYHNGKSDVAQGKATLIRGAMENPLEVFPTRILLFMLVEAEGWVISKNDEALLKESIPYLSRLTSERLWDDLIRIYQAVGKATAEASFIKYKLEAVSIVKVSLDEIKKNPALCQIKEVKLPPREQTLASRQQMTKI